MNFWLIDSTTLIALAKSGLAASRHGSVTQFLDLLLLSGRQVIITDVVRIEVTRNLSFPDAQVLNNWIATQRANQTIQYWELPSTAPGYNSYFSPGADGGERSISYLLNNTSIVGPNDTFHVVSENNFTSDQWYRDQTRITTSELLDTNRLMNRLRMDNIISADTRVLLHQAASEAGVNLTNPALRNLGDTLLDGLARLPGDESGVIRISGLDDIHWTDLSAAFRANWMRLASEAVGVAFIGLDAWATRQAFAEALARGDLAAADDILGGLIGRSFGGAFLSAIASGVGYGVIGGLPGAIIGGILGGIIGAIGGGEIGEWLLGLLNDIGISLSDFLDGLADMLRRIMGDPIVLDLDGDGIELTALAGSATHFDLDNDGIAERTGWVSPQDGFLVHDIDQDGQLDGIGELLGDANTDGYDVLAGLDANNDARIDANDAAFAHLLVWRDLNSDGVATADELQTMAQAEAANDNDASQRNAA